MANDKDVKEFLRCANDPVYFICNYVKVVHPVRGLVPFQLYGFQKRIISEIQEHRFNILRKFRQAGCTTLASGYALWFTIFQPHKTVAVLSKGEKEATELIERIQVMYEELPDWLQRPIKEKNKHTLRFNNGSVIKSRASGKQSGRSIAGSLLILDEAAFIEHIDTIWAAVYPIISTGGAVFALSTVNGMGNWFHRTYTEATQGLNRFNVIDIKWTDHPEYKRQPGYEHLYEEMASRSPPMNIDDWEAITRENIGFREWRQEYLTEFLGTGQTYLDGEILLQLQDGIERKYRNEYNLRLRVWKEAHPYYEYLISCDVALGRGIDYTAFHVFNLYNGEQVAEFYSDSTSIDEVAKIILNTASRYNTAYIAIERNTLGHVLIDHLVSKYEYENVLQDDKGEFGFQVTSANREILLAVMEEFVRTRTFKIRSERTINELNTFIINDHGKPEADANMHDDLVMSLALSAYVTKNIMNSTPMEHERLTNDNGGIFENPIITKGIGQSDEAKDYYKWLLS